MMLESALQNLVDPAILFFLLGVFVALIRSNLEIPPPVGRFLTHYLLLALGFKGGVALAEEGLSARAMIAVVLAILMAILVPAYSYLILRNRTDRFEAAAVAATYGSVSAVTFIAGQQFLLNNDIAFGGYMTVAFVVMESPAVVMAVLLSNLARAKTAVPTPSTSPEGQPLSMGKVLHEAFTDGGHLLLIGSLLVGWTTGAAGAEVMAPFTVGIFKGMLAFFLLEMGILVGRQLRESQAKLNSSLLVFAVAAPVLNAVLALSMAAVFGLQRGDGLLLALLSGSASYIVVPAIIRYAIPEARPGVYFTLALGVTFPFNIIVGIPLYFAASGLLFNLIG